MKVFNLDKTMGLIDSYAVLQFIKEGRDSKSIMLSWQSLDSYLIPVYNAIRFITVGLPSVILKGFNYPMQV